MVGSSYRNSTYLLITVLAIVNAVIMRLMLQKEMMDYIPELVISTFVAGTALFANLKLKIGIGFYVLCAAVIALILNFLFGEYFDLNNSSPLFNRFQHFFSSYAHTLFVYIFMIKLAGQMNINRHLEFIFIISLSAFLGTFIEIGEYVKDTFFYPQEPYQAGLADTNFDLMADIAGGLAAALHYRIQKLKLIYQIDRDT